MKIEFATTAGGIAGMSGGRLAAGSADTVVTTITTDSRELGERSFFIPLAGEKFDGHDYIEALANGGKIVGFLSARESDRDIAERTGTACVLCADTLKAFGSMGSRRRDEINPTVIGVTGTNGKTTTKELIWSVLEKKYPVLKNEKNYNNEVGVPYTLLHLDKRYEMAVIEMGMNHPGEIERLSLMAKPDVAVITNAGEGHLEFLGSVENVARAKSEILAGMKPGSTLFLNRDTRQFDLLCGAARDKEMNVVTFGISDSANIRPDEYVLDEKGVTISLDGIGYYLPLYGIHNVYNAVAAIAVARHFDVNAGIVRDALASFQNIDMRSQIIEKEYVVINDAYNSNPLSSRYALMSAAAVYAGRRKIAVLGDMKELGAESARYHRETGQAAAECGFDMLVAVGDMARHYADGATGAGMPVDCVQAFQTRSEAISYLRGTLRERDVVLVKGSRSMKMEEIADALVR